MSDSENDIDYYTDILRTLHEKNLYLHTQEQDNELNKKFEESFRKYSELRNTFFNIKDEFELKQIQMFNSNILFADLREQVNTKVKEFDELLQKSESLKKKSVEQQTQFDSNVMNWSKEIDDLSVMLEQNAYLQEVQEGPSKIDSLHKEIELIQKIHNEDIRVQNRDENNYLKDMRLITNELLGEVTDSELKLKKCTELESEINEYGAIINDIKKQIY